MSTKHPIIAVTGSSGAGTTTTTTAFTHIFRQLGINAAFIEGDSFHNFTRAEMEVLIRKSQAENRNLSYFGPEANNFVKLEECFQSYSDTGQGQTRSYLHTFDEAVPFNQMPGTFTQWHPLPENTDMLYYEGLHGGVVTEDANVAKHVDLLIGMVPIVNLEWIQKIIRDTSDRGHSREKVMGSIVRSMDDYIKHMTPQFSRTHINFQRVPTVDTSNPFSAKDIPSLDESFVVIRFRDINNVDFPYYLSMIDGSFMSRVNTLVVPGGKMSLAMELILTPLIKELMHKKAAENA
ncbi:phosphoribulokinase [Shewanella sp. 1_MG-2023]|uniref:Phosphoribulokinase n=1 Tax=Shewanella electrodiphila TaxID=934143 RepID=A0ABT0KPM3_9GAMM|nr:MULTISPECIES: phosphoribulokinase [Shewanella]MCC4834138.1 phosphoribulokinase [Shewanella sp. 10N.7]MCL1045639.1 phosphoribulokinase [Shewanella electrodiphila]MDO6611594.1 phosphoribulokinase [Shewanella sp. 7_MG-2023]MDO6771449.1 phosphoribulokinase [Shewanella sp. 2_MG-2023]MDO6793675.1 phosphoribulokinase [Shewanella sp. 1_MG-2023]